MINRAFKFLLKPTRSQEKTFVNWTGSNRFIWNQMLEANKLEYEKTKKFIWSHDFQKRLPGLKQEHEWLREIPSQALQQRCDDLAQALKMTARARGGKRSGFPKFKSKHNESDNTLRIPQQGGQLKPTKKAIKIPKMGWVSWLKHRPLDGHLKSITIKKENDRWWCVCLCESNREIEPIIDVDISDVVGIDLGLKDFAITSDGEIFETRKYYRKQQKKLRRQQRTLARRHKGGKNRERARRALNKTHFEIKNQRKDTAHKISSQIAKDYQVVSVEDLNVKGMTKNKYLAKSISDQGWSQFLGYLAYKMQDRGHHLVKIGRFMPSSKTCSCCGHVQDMPLNIRVFDCESCGLVLDRDANAAINIRRWGIDKLHRAGTARIHAYGDTSIGGEAYDSSRYVSLK